MNPLEEAKVVGAIKTSTIACSAGCKREVEDPEKAGWGWLPISRRWRCQQCTRELLQMNEHINGD